MTDVRLSYQRLPDQIIHFAKDLQPPTKFQSTCLVHIGHITSLRAPETSLVDSTVVCLVLYTHSVTSRTSERRRWPYQDQSYLGRSKPAKREHVLQERSAGQAPIALIMIPHHGIGALLTSISTAKVVRINWECLNHRGRRNFVAKGLGRRQIWAARRRLSREPFV